MSQMLSDMVGRLIEQARIDVSRDPRRYLDPVGIGSPVLLSKGRVRFSTKTLLTILGGALAAGGATAAVLLAGGSGGEGERGSISVQFR